VKTDSDLSIASSRAARTTLDPVDTRSVDAQLLANPFERFVLSPRVSGWIYAYANPQPLPIPQVISERLEIAVQIRGDWTLTSWGRAPQRFEAGSVFVIPPLTRHTYSFDARGGAGLQVGFEIEVGVGHPPFRAEARRWRALADCVLAGRRDKALAEEIEREALGACDEDTSPWSRAQREMRAYLDRPLYLDHLAEALGVHGKTLSRLFLARAGVPPIRFRSELRMRRAITLLWSRPELSVRSIAESVGFEDVRAIHRAARQTYGLTPAQLGRRPDRSAR
jgi:AraC-like DNA-binding protein